MKRLLFGLCALSAGVAAANVTILDFSRPEDLKGVAVVIGCKNNGHIPRVAEPNSASNAVHFAVGTNDASWVSFHIPAFGVNVKKIPVEHRSTSILWRFRVNKASKHLSFNTTYKMTDGKRYQVKLPVVEVGKDLEYVQHAELGWNRDDIPFNPAELDRLEIVSVGDSDLEIRSIEFLAPNPVRPVPDASRPRVDPDAFQLYPEPRLATVSEETLPLADLGFTYETLGDVPSGAIAAFTDEMKAFYGYTYRSSHAAKIVFARGNDPAAKQRLAARGLTEDFAKIKFDGYALVVDDQGVLIAANEGSGLFFGAQQLAEAVKMTTGDDGTPAVRKLRVVDWPRLGIRPFQDMVRTHGHRNKYEVPFYTEMLRRVAFGSRFNMVGLELGAFYKWASAPDIPTVPQAWTREDLEAVVDYVNDRGMCVYPRMNGLGHVGHWPLKGKAEVERYGEDGTTAVLCTAKPAANRMLLNTCAEILGVCSKNPAYRPRYFHMGLDEVRWDTYDVPETQRCERCRGRAKNAIFLEQVKLLHDWCVSKDVRMVMCADMINRYHNGYNRFRCADVLKEFPRDIILDAWASHDTYEIEEHAKDGFENWKLLTAYNDEPQGEDYITGCGINMCVYNWWLTHAANYGVLAQRLLADSMWRAAPVQRRAERKAKIARWADFLMRNWSRKPIPSATENFETLPLETTQTLALDLPATTALGRVPVAPKGVPGARGALVADVTNGFSVAVNRRAASLCLLQATHIDLKDIYDVPSRAKHPSLGVLIAEGAVRYTDGSTAKIEVRQGWNVVEWDYVGKARGGIWSCYPLDGRAAWIGEKNAATLHEWVNPHPEKEIAAIDFRGIEKKAQYALFALTARAAK